MRAFQQISSRLVVIPVDDVDTDQIIPARFLKITDKSGLGEKLFSNWRYLEDGSDNPNFALNQAGMRGRQILLAGDNFGCGSSREHAPWALDAWGFRVIISTSFADIFRSNALKNGLLLVQIDAPAHARLSEAVAAAPDLEVSVDLVEQRLQLPDGTPDGMTVPFPMDAFAKRCLLEGMDQLGYLLSHDPAIARFEGGQGA